MKSKFRVFAVIMTCFGTLIVVSLGLIIALNFATSINIFSRMLSQNVIRGVEGLELALRSHLDAAEHQADFVIENLRAGNVSFDQPTELAHFVSGSLAAAPQITGLVIVSAEGRVLRARRENFGSVVWNWAAQRAGRPAQEIRDELQDWKDPYWAPPFYRDTLKSALMTYRVPIWNGEAYLGYIAVAISTRALSHLVSDLSDPPNSNVFLLYGEDRVLAHPYLVLQNGLASVEKPLLSSEEIFDPIIQNLDTMSSTPTDLDLEGIDLGVIDYEGQRYGVVAKPITDYGDTPIVVGAYFEGSDIASLMTSILRTILLGGIVVLVGLGIAWWLARIITRPIRQTAKVASSIATLDFDTIDALPTNRIQEIDDLATSFNAMLVGLKSFGRYVPRRLVRQLIRDNRVGAGIEERELTVMFTDIAGFTSTCEGMSPPDVAEFINHHLTLVSKCIENEGGTIDKYIGDAVMAFWGAPDTVDNPTLRAVRAAAALKKALAEDNQTRATQGLPLVRVRVGIHSGRLIVGDIGSPERINYTVIGDVVNTTQRLEGLGKEVDPTAESIVLVSRPVKDIVGDDATFENIGNMKVKGRLGEIEVYRLE